MNTRVWKLGVALLVLALVGVPVALATAHGITHDQMGNAIPLHKSPWGVGGGVMCALVAGGAYSNRTMGNGKSIPGAPGGGVDINALIGQMVDRGLWWYYYTLKLNQGATVASQYTLFNSAQGSSDPYPLSGSPVLSKVETNMPNTSTNGFNAPRDLILDQIGFYFTEDTTLSDIITFDKYSYFELKIIDKIFFEGKLRFHPAGTGIAGYSTKTSESAWNLGTANQTATVRFGTNNAKYIAPQMNWSLMLYFPPGSGPSAAAPVLQTTNQGGNGVEFVTFLKGLTDRAVQ